MGSQRSNKLLLVLHVKNTGTTKFKAKRNLESCHKHRIPKQKAKGSNYAFVLNEAVMAFIFLGTKGLKKLNSCLHSNSNFELLLK